MRNFICLMIFGLFFVACQDGNTETDTEQEKVQEEQPISETTTTPVATSQSSNSTESPTFLIENFEDGDIPKSTISIDMGGSKLKVGDAIRCEKIESKDYDKYHIPSNVIDACGGWWAGTGEYFYLTKSEEGDYYEIMKASIGEEDKEFNGYPYLSVMRFVKKISN